ncbi:MAG: signal recognition particle-docking protein FtsY, partial [Gemmatimonadetes bacterium]|nr:signal recognition particle-docking protein FtsY [Gemmatimonadota bacterium]
MAGLFDRIRKGLSRTREAVAERIATVVGGRRLDEEVLEEIEEILLTADVGVDTAVAVTDGLRARAAAAGAEADVFDLLQTELEACLLTPPEVKINSLPTRPYVVLVVGVNGVGKTTTIGKLAQRHAEAGHKVLLAACDTFRAGAVAQLDVWAERAGVEIIRAQQGADPAAVAFDALAAAQSRDADVVFIDTAGRLHNK